jgi:hypothetical protein
VHKWEEDLLLNRDPTIDHKTNLVMKFVMVTLLKINNLRPTLIPMMISLKILVSLDQEVIPSDFKWLLRSTNLTQCLTKNSTPISFNLTSTLMRLQMETLQMTKSFKRNTILQMVHSVI